MSGYLSFTKFLIYKTNLLWQRSIETFPTSPLQSYKTFLQFFYYAMDYRLILPYYLRPTKTYATHDFSGDGDSILQIHLKYLKELDYRRFLKQRYLFWKLRFLTASYSHKNQCIQNQNIFHYFNLYLIIIGLSSSQPQ